MTAPSFDDLVARHEGRVYAICRTILRDEHLGADAAQDVFLRLWRQGRAGAWPRNVSAWLGRVAVTASLDQVRRRRVRDEATTRAAATVSDEDEAPRPDEIARAAELQRALDRAVERLPEGQRLVFLLRHESGLTLSEIASTLGVALPTVKTQFARACVKLQARLTAFEPGRELPAARGPPAKSTRKPSDETPPRSPES